MVPQDFQEAFLGHKLLAKDLKETNLFVGKKKILMNGRSNLEVIKEPLTEITGSSRAFQMGRIMKFKSKKLFRTCITNIKG